MVIVLMGVAGSGKTAVGRQLAQTLALPFYDGDDYHPPQNVAKMAQRIPLADDDRIPWLARLRAIIVDQLQKGETAVVACSALKKKYRQQLRQEDPGIFFVHLQGEFDLIWQRLTARKDHFMKASMLQSQFEALEPPDESEGAITLSVTPDVTTIAAAIVEIFHLEEGGGGGQSRAG